MIVAAAVDNDIYPPRFGGAQRSFGLARGIARRNAVRVLCVVPNRSTAAAAERVAGVDLVRLKAWHTSVAWRLERWGLAPLFAAASGHRRNNGRYRAALGEGVQVLAADLHLASLLGSPGPALRVHTSHNVEADRFRSAAPRVFGRARWAAAIARLERTAVESADLTVVCSDGDAARMQELYGVRAADLAVIPNGYDETELAPASPEARARARAALGIGEGEYVAAFVGADWEPNRAALRVLTDHVFPALRGGGFRLLVLGSVARSLGAAREPWLIPVGETDDLAGQLAAADAGLNPVLAGGGSNVKLPGYLAMGLAVITTPFGARGYAALEPHLVFAATDGFAEALRTRPAGFGVRAEPAPPALAEYAWGRLGERLGELYEARLVRSPRDGAKGAA